MTEMVKFQLRLSEDLRNKAKDQAEKMGLSLSLVVRLKLQEWLKDPNSLRICKNTTSRTIGA